MGQYEDLQAMELRGVQQQFGGLRQNLEKGIHNRRIGRSGFAGEAMTKLGAQEGQAIADVNAGLSDRLINYQQKERELALMSRMAKGQKKKKGSWVGAALGAVGMIGMGLAMSDKRAKKDIKPMDGALDKLKDVKGVSYEWKGSGKKGGGFIAQELEKIYPESVARGGDGGSMGVDYPSMTAKLLEAYKDQQKDISWLKKKLGA